MYADIQCMLYLLLSWIYGGNKFSAIRFTWLAIKLFILQNNCEGKNLKFTNQRQILTLSLLLHISLHLNELCSVINFSEIVNKTIMNAFSLCALTKLYIIETIKYQHLRLYLLMLSYSYITVITQEQVYFYIAK